MPGITGFISSALLCGQAERLEQMLTCLRHESNDVGGSLANEELGLAVGWVGHPGSLSAGNPFWNERGDLGLIICGEHYPDEDDTDSRTLLKRYEDLGIECFEKLNGVFSGLVMDLRRRTVVLFNDRYGLGRIYWHQSDSSFSFASEAKCLLKLAPELRRLDTSGLGEFFSCGCALQNRTLFTGVRLLPGASAWTLTPGGAVKKESYFDRRRWEALPELTPEDYYERLQEKFTRILPRYFRSSRPIGLSLTGGLDSRMIIAGALPPPSTLPCHTFGGMHRECADVRLARRIAQASGQTHRVIPATADFFSEFAGLAERSVYCTDGAMDVTGAVELFVNRVVREQWPVRLTGNYGSEILRGSVAFKPMRLSASIFDPDFHSHVEDGATTYASERQGRLTQFIAFKQVPWFHYARLAVEQSQLTVRSPFLDNEIVALAHQAPSAPSVNQALAQRYIADRSPPLADIPTDRGVVGKNGFNGGRLAAFRREFMPRVEYVFDYGMPQWLARWDYLLRPLRIERLFLGRQKFYHFRSWYRDRLSCYVRETLLDPRALGRSYLNRRRVEQIVNAHVAGRGNYTLEITKLLTLELLQRKIADAR